MMETQPTNPERLDRIYSQTSKEEAKYALVRKVGIVVAALFVILGLTGALLNGLVLHATDSTLFCLSIAAGGVGLIALVSLLIWNIVAAKQKRAADARIVERNTTHTNNLSHSEVSSNNNNCRGTSTKESDTTAQTDWQVESGLLSSLSIAVKSYLENASYENAQLIKNILSDEHFSIGSDISLLHGLLQQIKWGEYHTNLLQWFIAAAQEDGSLNAQDALGNTALHYARTCKQAHMLINAGADLSIRNHKNETALHMSLHDAKVPSGLFLMLLEYASVEIVDGVDSKGCTVLATSIDYTLQRGWIDNDWQWVVFTLLAKGAEIQSTLSNAQLTNKLIKVGRGYNEAGRTFFKKLVNYAQKTGCLNTQDKEGNTLLHKVKNAMQAEILIRAGASLKIQNSVQKTPLHLAASSETLFFMYLEHATLEDLAIKDHEGNLPIHQWVYYNRLSLNNVRSLFSNPLVIESINLANNEGATLLHWALKEKYIDLANLFIAFASLTQPDRQGVTPLHLAFNYLDSCANHKLAKRVLKKLNSTHILYKDQQGNTWLHILADLCSRGGYWRDNSIFCDFVIQLIKLGLDSEVLNNKQIKANDIAKQEWFSQAINEGKQKLKTPLLEQDIYDIFNTSKEEIAQEGESTLFWLLNQPIHVQLNFLNRFQFLCGSCNTCYTDLLSYLFDQLTDEELSAPSKDGESLPHFLLKLMISNHSELNRNKLLRSWEKLFLKLLTRDPSLVIEGEKRSTLLHWVLNGEESCLNVKCFNALVELAVKQGHLNYQDQEGNTPLSLALLKQQFSRANRLIAKGADVNVSNLQNETPLSIAIRECRDKNTLHALFSERIIYQADDVGNTWLHYAAYNDNLVAIKLFKNKISYLSQNHDGSTPLHVALQKGSVHAVHALMSLLQEDEIHVVDNKQNTYLHVLARMPADAIGNPLILFLLKGADPFKKNADGTSAAELLKAVHGKTEASIALFFKIEEELEKTDKRSDEDTYAEYYHRADLQFFGLPINATKQEAKRAFLKMAATHMRPDKNEKNESDKIEMIKEAQEKYARLMTSTFFDPFARL